MSGLLDYLRRNPRAAAQQRRRETLGSFTRAIAHAVMREPFDGPEPSPRERRAFRQLQIAAAGDPRMAGALALRAETAAQRAEYHRKWRRARRKAARVPGRGAR